jgi:hypothetical protein
MRDEIDSVHICRYLDGIVPNARAKADGNGATDFSCVLLLSPVVRPNAPSLSFATLSSTEALLKLT